MLAQGRNCLTNYVWMMCFRAEIQVGCKFCFYPLLRDNVCLFGMRFASSKCKILLQHWIGAKSNLVLVGEELGENLVTWLAVSIYILTFEAFVVSSWHPVIELRSNNRQQWGQCVSASPKDGCWESKICKNVWCLNTVVFVVLQKCGERILSNSQDGR